MSVGESQAAADEFGVLVERAVALARSRRAILGISGPPGAGKSTLAARLLAAIADRSGGAFAAHVPMDGFHLADVQLERLGLRDRKGAPETFDAAGYAALLQRLRRDDAGVVYAPGFERDLEQPIAAAVAVPGSARLIVTEGNYLLVDGVDWRLARRCVDEVWYCELQDDERLRRLVARHVAYGKSADEARAWVERSDEANARLIETTRDAADLIVNTAGLSPPA